MLEEELDRLALVAPAAAKRGLHPVQTHKIHIRSAPDQIADQLKQSP